MKRSLKKIPALLCLAALLVLAGCASKETLPNEEFYQAKADLYAERLAAMDAASLEAEVQMLEENFDDFEQEVELYPYIGGMGQKFEFTADAYLGMLKSYESNLEDFGAYVGLKEYEGGSEDADGNVKYSAVYEFDAHDMRMSLEFNKNNVITGVTLDPIYSMGEIAQKAALNTLIGMGSVFVVLIILCFIISCFKYISVLENKSKQKGKKKEAKKEEKPAAPAAAPAPVKKEEAPAADPMADTQLVAVITAAVAASMGTSSDGFVVRSIKRRTNNKWKKA